MIDKIHAANVQMVSKDKESLLSKQKLNISAQFNYKPVNLNNSPLYHYNRVSFGIDDAGKRRVNGVKNVQITDRDFASEINASRMNERKESFETSIQDDRRYEESLGWGGYSLPIRFYPEDLEKLNKMENIDDQIEFLADLREKQRYIYVDVNGKEISEDEAIRKYAPKNKKK